MIRGEAMSTRKYASDQRQMFGYQAEDRLPRGHICFLIDEIVDDLDLGTPARGNSIRGAPSYDPRMMVKILFYGYVRGIRSSRRLAADCRENIGFMKLCQGEVPDFRTIALFRRENESLLERAFSSLVRRLVEARVVSVSHIITDGSKVHANARNGRIIHRKFFDEVKRAIKEWMSSSADLDAAEQLREKLSSVGVSTSSDSVEGLQDLVDRCSKAVEEGERGKAQKVSITDPGCRFMRDGIGGRINLGYNVQAAIDADTGLVVGCDVTQDVQDSRSLVRMVETVERISNETVEAVDADSGFFRSDTVHSLEEKESVYDASRDVFCCSEGNEHVFKGFAHKRDKEFVRVYVSQRRCDGCPRRERCFGRSQLKRHRIRKHVDFVWLTRHRKRFLEPAYRQRLEGRRLIESLFGHWKHNLRFRKFLLRGLSGARIETFLVAAASLLRRLSNPHYS